MGSTFCTRVTATGASSSSKLQRSSFGLLISRGARCENPPSVSLQPPGVTGAPCHETEPLPQGFCLGLVLLSCPRQRWRLCSVLFALSCLALGSLPCPHSWDGFISPFRPQLGFAELVLAQDHGVMLNKVCPAVGLVPVAVLGSGRRCRECWRGVNTPGGCASYSSSRIYRLQSSVW